MLVQEEGANLKSKGYILQLNKFYFCSLLYLPTFPSQTSFKMQEQPFVWYELCLHSS